MNLGQLSLLLRARYLVDVVGYNHVRGLPLRAAELADAITQLVTTDEETSPHAANGAAAPAVTAAGARNGAAAAQRPQKESVR